MVVFVTADDGSCAGCGITGSEVERFSMGAPISLRLPGIMGLQQKAAGGNLPIFVNTGHRNVNLGFSSAAMAEQKANLALQTCGAVAKAQIRNERWSRDLKRKKKRSIKHQLIRKLSDT